MVPNLMIGFGIDEIQAEYVAEIKLRHLNREYILKRTEEIEQLEADIAEMEAILDSTSKVQGHHRQRAAGGHQKVRPAPARPVCSMPTRSRRPQRRRRRSPIIPCTLFFTAEGYFKKITPQSLRMSGEQKLKEGDAHRSRTVEATNNAESALLHRPGHRSTRPRPRDFADTKASVLGDYRRRQAGLRRGGELPATWRSPRTISGYMLFFFENGKVAKVELASYATKTNRRKLVGAYSDKSPVVAIVQAPEDGEFLLTATSGRMLLVHTGAIAAKATRNTQRRAGHDPQEAATCCKG